MSAAATAPGLYFEAVRLPPASSPLRTDVAGFAGRTRRGPFGTAVRVTGWREYLQVFGGLLADADTPLAIQGYFENGGDAAWIVRLPAGRPPQEAGTAASVLWDLTRSGPDQPQWIGWLPADAGFAATRFRIEASSPGAWGKSVRVDARYRNHGTSGQAEVDLVIRAADEPEERLIGLDPAHIHEAVAVDSNLIRLVPLDAFEPQAGKGTGPQLLRWQTLLLDGGSEHEIDITDYTAALTALGDQIEVALTGFPDLQVDLGNQARNLQLAAIAQAEALHDRLVLLDLPPTPDVSSALQWSLRMRRDAGEAGPRAAAAYHPPVSVLDPLGGAAQPLRTIAPSGHVAGLISALDRSRGAQYTPANATLDGVADVVSSYTLAERAALNDAGVNLLLCKPGQGVQVWGGRTLLEAAQGRYIAHRRLIHRLVRAARRVAEPLVFETNGPALWLALVRAITSVLLEAWRAGGLQGARAEEAFRVLCDATNNPQDQQDLGIVVCEISLAPAVPMEFITLRISLSAQGALDVFES
jgi:phage tail sheath protein FI